MARFGAVDVGSNSVRSLVIEAAGDALSYVASSSEITRITEGIGEGRTLLLPQAIERTAQAVGRAFEILHREGVEAEHAAFFATESLRSAENVDDAREILEARASGISLAIVSGEEEGRLGVEGALLALPEAATVFDLGGGSLEVCSVLGGGVSLPLGAVRLLNLFRENRENLAAYLLDELRGVSVTGPLVGVGGTSSTTAMILQGVDIRDYHPSRVHGRILHRQDIAALRERLAPMSVDERKQVRGMPPGRADILVSGLAAIECLLERAGIDVYTHSECDLLWGRVRRLAEAEGHSVRSARF